MQMQLKHHKLFCWHSLTKEFFIILLNVTYFWFYMTDFIFGYMFFFIRILLSKFTIFCEIIFWYFTSQHLVWPWFGDYFFLELCTEIGATGFSFRSKSGVDCILFKVWTDINFQSQFQPNSYAWKIIKNNYSNFLGRIWKFLMTVFITDA